MRSSRCLIVLTLGVVPGCATTGTQVRAEDPGHEPLSVAADPVLAGDHQDIDVGTAGSPLLLRVSVGDPARQPSQMQLQLGDRIVRVGLTPRPAEERDPGLDDTVEVRGSFLVRRPPHAGPVAVTTTELAAVPVLMPEVPEAFPLMPGLLGSGGH